MMHGEIVSFQSRDMRFGLKISKDELHSLHKMCSASSSETGGVLIGYYSDDLLWANVTKATSPPAGSVRCASSFIREGKPLSRLLDIYWKKKQYYIGEWHFHPNASAEPSSTDRNTMRSLASAKSLHCPEPILLIIGGNCKHWHIHCSVFVDNTEIRLLPVEQPQ